MACLCSVSITEKEKTQLTPLKAIRAKCLDCMCDQPKEVRLCPSTDCPLYPFRMGKNPNRAGIGGENSHSRAENDADTAEGE